MSTVIVPTKEWREIDKSSWPRGPWDSEVDRKQWTDPDTGLPCLIVRHDRSGHWCGYVGVREGHPSFGKGYDDCDYGAHGGLTYADHCDGKICHETEVEDRVWWLGFDCAHAGDASPRYHENLARMVLGDHPGFQDVYRDQAYVESECKSLAAQLTKTVP
jgi:hypothetical protein